MSAANPTSQNLGAQESTPAPRREPTAYGASYERNGEMKPKPGQPGSGIFPQDKRVTSPPKYTPLQELGNSPAIVDCPFCGQRITTKVIEGDSTSTTIAAAFCCLFAGIGAIIPYICHWCSNAEHYCSHCNKQIVHKPHDGPAQILVPPHIQQQMVYPQPADQKQQGPNDVHSHELAELRRELLEQKQEIERLKAVEREARQTAELEASPSPTAPAPAPTSQSPAAQTGPAELKA